VTIASFLELHCLFPFGLAVGEGADVDDYLYMVPAITYSMILVLTFTLYVLRFGLQCWMYRRYKSVAPTTPTAKMLRHIPRIFAVAAMITLERILYRHASGFALGLELTIIKVGLVE
jgi:hypothetical protein